MREGRARTGTGGSSGFSPLLWGLPVLLLAVSALCSHRMLLSREGSPAGNAVHRSSGILSEIGRRPGLALGFRNALADLVWLQAVQVSGEGRMSRDDYGRLDELIRTATDLDPRFLMPYLLGGVLLADSPSHVPSALRILERGRANHPEEWRLPFYIGYIRYFSLGDSAGAGAALEEASRISGSPPYLPFLASRMFSEGNAPGTALAFLERLLREETDPARQEVLHRRIREVIVERDIQALEQAVAAYRDRTGILPERLTDLVGAGLIRAIPEEPNGGSYLLSPGGTVRSDRVASRLKVFRKQ